ncbi:MAG: hypothetical protein DRG78_04770 [Epsilonproteobacteria bacterium]|nr:MAG: hypothetical protein DRG78_04770 [Campylobacterota bacterium]
MEKSIKILEEISQKCYSDTTVYKFSKNLNLPDKYKKGRIDASSWINDLIYYYVQKEKNFLKEFIQHINDQKEIIAIINNGDYKNGLYDQLQEVELHIKES